jgi:hypothetical protein
MLADATGTLVNLICPFVESKNVKKTVIHQNRLNLIAVPTDSIAPGAAELDVQENASIVYSHIAVQLCSAASLWVGVTGIKNHLVGDMRNIQMQRTFVRYVDASELVDDIVLAVLKEASNPLSRVFNVHGAEFDSLNDTQTQMAIELLVQKFIEVNKESLDLTPPLPYEGLSKLSKGLWAAIKMYFEFLFKYLLREPGRWASEKVAVVKKRVADTANKMIFGDDSAYQIVVNGISGGPQMSGQNAGQTNSSAAEQLREVSGTYLRNETNLFPAPFSPREVWLDFIQIALGLLDGGTPRSGYPMPQTEGVQDSLVLPNPASVVPPVNGESFILPANIPVTMSGVVIGADDPYLALVAWQQLKDSLSLENSTAVDAELNEQLSLLENWMNQNTSFAWNVGLKIASNLNTARLRLRQIGMGISAKFSENKLAEAEVAARKAIWNMIKVSAGIVLATAGLAFTPLFALTPLLIGGAIVLVIWNMIGSLLFHKAMRNYFQTIHQLDEEAHKHSHNMKQRLAFARDVQRLSVVYIQYRSWVRLLAETVYHPFGEELQEVGVRVSPIRLLTDLTKSLSVGRLATNDADKDKLLEGVKRRFFQKGWRVANFDRFLGALGADTESIWGDEGVGNSSVLAKIASLADPGASRDSLLEQASKSARSMAVAAADYRGWPVLATGEASIMSSNTCSKFLSPLLAPAKYLNGSLLNPRDVGDVNEVQPQGAKVFMDSRIEVGILDNLNVEPLDRRQLTDYQELDFMAVRVERTVLFGYTSLAFLEKSREAVEIEERRAAIKPTALPEVEG